MMTKEVSPIRQFGPVTCLLSGRYCCCGREARHCLAVRVNERQTRAHACAKTAIDPRSCDSDALLSCPLGCTQVRYVLAAMAPAAFHGSAVELLEAATTALAFRAPIIGLRVLGAGHPRMCVLSAGQGCSCAA